MTISTTTPQQSFQTPPSLGLTDSDRLVLTVAEAGALLGISRTFAYELVARGELPVIRLGRRRLVPKRALLELVGIDPTAIAGAAPSSPLGGGTVQPALDPVVNQGTMSTAR
jgi:excisionase family DNA binding protein